MTWRGACVLFPYYLFHNRWISGSDSSHFKDAFVFQFLSLTDAHSPESSWIRSSGGGWCQDGSTDPRGAAGDEKRQTVRRRSPVGHFIRLHFGSFRSHYDFPFLIPGIYVLWRFLRIYQLLVKRWGIKCHVALITFPCSSNWRGRKLFLGSVSWVLCLPPLCLCNPTGLMVSCFHTQLHRRKAVLASFRANCSEHSAWRLSTMAGRTRAKWIQGDPSPICNGSLMQ